MTNNEATMSAALAERAAAPQRDGPTIAELIARQRPQIEAAVPRHVSAERLARVALTELRRTPKLGDCTPASLLGGVMLSAQLGLELGAPLGQAYLVPYGKECQFILGYRGIIALAFNSGKLRDVQARDVYDRDAFTYRYGLNEALDHTPHLGADRGDLRALWGLANFADGGRFFVVVPLSEIEDHRRRSKAADAGPWVTDYVAMAKKTVVRIMEPWLPLSAEQSQQFATDNAIVHDLPMDFRDVIDTAPEQIPPPIATDADGPAPADVAPPNATTGRRGHTKKSAAGTDAAEKTASDTETPPSAGAVEVSDAVGQPAEAPA